MAKKQQQQIQRQRRSVDQKIADLQAKIAALKERGTTPLGEARSNSTTTYGGRVFGHGGVGWVFGHDGDVR